MKPFWGACTWEFVESNIEVPTSITDIVETEGTTSQPIYDLSGRRVSVPANGIYIVKGQKKVY
jgi:hypothetical protein